MHHLSVILLLLFQLLNISYIDGLDPDFSNLELIVNTDSGSNTLDHSIKSYESGKYALIEAELPATDYTLEIKAKREQAQKEKRTMLIVYTPEFAKDFSNIYFVDSSTGKRLMHRLIELEYGQYAEFEFFDPSIDDESISIYIDEIIPEISTPEPKKNNWIAAKKDSKIYKSDLVRIIEDNKGNVVFDDGFYYINDEREPDQKKEKREKKKKTRIKKIDSSAQEILDTGDGLRIVSDSTKYEILEDLSCEDGQCLEIDADDVVIDGRNREIFGSVHVRNSRNVHLSNMVIDPQFGIIVDGTNDSTYTNITYSNITAIGIWLVNDSNNNNFTNITINSSGSGILISNDSDANLFTNLTINLTTYPNSIVYSASETDFSDSATAIDFSDQLFMQENHYTHDDSAEDTKFYVNSSAIYRAFYSSSHYSQTITANRGIVELYLKKNGSIYTPSNTTNYNRRYSGTNDLGDQAGSSAATLINLSDGDYLELFSTIQDGDDDGATTHANETWILLEKLDVDSAQVYSTSNQGGASWVDVAFAAQTHVDTDTFTHSTSSNNERVYVNKTGWYRLSYSCSFYGASGNRHTVQNRLFINTTQHTPSNARGYVRGADDTNGPGHSNSVQASTLAYIYDGGYVVLEALAALTNTRAQAYKCWLNIEELDRPAIQVYDSSGGQDLSTGATAIDFDAYAKSDSNFFTHSTSTNPSRVYVKFPGWYKLTYTTGFQQGTTSLNKREIHRSYIQKNGADEIIPSSTRTYLRAQANGIQESNYAETLTYLDSGDYVQVYVNRETGSDDDLSTIADESWLIVEKLEDGDAIQILSGQDNKIDCQGSILSGSDLSTSNALYSEDQNTTMTNCTISGFNTALNLSGATYSSFYANNITSNIWVYDSTGTGNSYNTSNMGNIYYFEDGSASWDTYDIYSTDADKWSDSGEDNPFSSSTISEWIGSGSDYYPYSLTEVEVVTGCRNFTSANTLYTLTENITINGSSCYEIQADNITLDCDGYYVIGNNTIGTKGIYSDSYNSTIENCFVDDFDIGICLNSSDNSTLLNNMIYNGTKGLCSYDSDSLNITQNTILDPSSHGINLNSSASSSLTLNTITSAGESAINLISTTSSTLTNNTLLNSTSYAISLDSGSSSNLIYHNNLSSDSWISDSGSSNSFNTSGHGNFYYFADSTASWDYYDIVDSDGDYWSDSGEDRPFDSSLSGGAWSGNGADYHPADPKDHSPDITYINLTPTTAYDNDTLVCNITSIDDLSTYLDIYYEWYKDDVNQTELAGSITISEGTNSIVSDTSAEAAPQNSPYKRTISLSDSTPTDEYQVLITLNTSTLSNPYSNISSDGSDIRFTDENLNELSYWIEDFNNTGDSRIWAKVNSSGTDTLYMYYGNSTADSESNQSSTFSYSEPRLVGYLLHGRLNTSSIRVLSLCDNNSIIIGSNTYDLNFTNTTTISNSNFNTSTPIYAKCLMHVDGFADGTDIANPISWASDRYYYRQERDGNVFYIISPWGTASVNITESGTNQGSSPYTITSTASTITDVTITDNEVMEVVSDIPVLVAFVSTNSYGDSMAFFPPSTDYLYGIGSNYFQSGAGPSGASLSWINSSGDTGSSNLGSYTSSETGPLGTWGSAGAYRIKSSTGPTNIFQNADQDGRESTNFLTKAYMGTLFGSSNPTGYIVIAAPTPSTNVTVYYLNGTEYGSSTGGSRSDVNKIGFGTGATTTIISNGWYMESDAPIHAYFEDDYADTDETNLWTWPMMRQYNYSQHPEVSSIGTQEDVVLENADLSAGEDWYCRARAYDGNSYSSWYSSNELTILQSEQQGEDEQDITSCKNLTNPNSQYNLTQNISSSSDTCLRVQAENVTIDCKSFYIIGDNTSSTSGIYSDEFNTTIIGCNIKNYSYGIFFNSSNSSSISNTSITDTQNDDVKTSSSSGTSISNVSASGSSRIVVSGNEASLDGGNQIIYATVFVEGAANAQISNLYVDPEYGLVVNGTTDSTFTNLTLTNISNKGLWIMNSSHNNTFTNISINTTGSGHGIYVESGENSSLDCLGGEIIGTNTSSTYGVYSNQFNTTVKNCIIQNFSTGIYIDGDSADYANITNNTINLTYATSCSYSNGVCNGVFISQSDLADVNDNQVYVYRYAISLYSSDFNTVDSNQVNASDYYGINIYSGKNNTVQYNNASSPFYAIRLESTANNTIQNNDGSGSWVIYLGSSSTDNIIQNNSLIGSSSLFNIQSDSNILRYNNASASGSALYLSDAEDNNITYNRFNSTGTGTTSGTIYLIAAMGVAPSDSNIFIGNIVNSTSTSSSALRPVYIDGASHNIFTNNTLYSSASSSVPAIDIREESMSENRNNTFYNNTITAPVWVDDSGVNNYYNNSDGVGNIYYFANGTGSWEVFDISSTSAPGYADGGTDRPFNSTTVGGNFTGAGNPQDYHPYTENSPPDNNLYCGELNISNTVYNMTQNLTNDSICFNITAQNITLDCKGFTITGNNSSGNWAVYSDQSNSTIKNCYISNFSTGIYIDGDSADYANLTNNTIDMDYATCDYDDGRCNGIFIHSADFCTVEKSNISSQAYAIAIYDSSNSNVFSTTTINTVSVGIMIRLSCNDNTVSNMSIDSGGSALQVRDSDRTTIKYSNITSPGYSIYVVDDSQDTNITANRLFTPKSGALYTMTVYLSTADNSIVKDNYIEGYCNYSNYGALATYGSTGNIDNLVFDNNTINALGGVAISLSGARYAEIYNNTIYNASEGLYVYSDSNTNEFVQNNITSSIWINDSGSSNTFNNTDTGNIYYFANGTGSWEVFDITSSSAPGYADGGTDRPFNSTTVGGNFTGAGNPQDYHPYTENSPPDNNLYCGELNISNTVYNMTQNLTNSSICFNITATNITLDCKGFSITGDNTSDISAIYTDQPNTTIKNCIISSFDNGIRINTDNADYANITNNSIDTPSISCSTPEWDCTAIYINNSDYCSINNNYYLRGWPSIHLADADLNIIEQNNLTSFDVFGHGVVIRMDDSDNNSVRHNNASGAGSEVTLAGSSNNTIEHNNISEVTTLGAIEISSSSIDNTVQHNYLDVYSDPIYIYQSGQNTIFNNTFITTESYNSCSLIYDSDRNNLTQNYFECVYDSNDDYGLKLDSSSDSNIVSNNTFNNTDSGSDSSPPLGIVSGTNNSFSYNRIVTASSSTTPGIYIASSQTDNSFYANNIKAPVWINDSGSSNFYNNSEGVGNIYYFPNGTGSWEIFDITSTSAPGYADGGTDRPFNSTTVGGNFTGAGNPQDYHPYTENSPSNSPPQIEEPISFTNASSGHWFYANATASDADGGTDIISWSATSTSGTCINNSNSTSGDNRTVVFNCSGSAFAETEINITFTDSDSASNSTWANNTYPNQIPQMSSVSISPEDADTDENLSADANDVSDPDSDTTTEIYNWILNGTSYAVLNTPFDTNVSTDTSGAIKDYSSNENDGTLCSGASTPVWNSSGRYGGAYVYDGTDDCIEFGDLGVGDSYTAEAWIYPYDLTGTGDQSTYGFTIMASSPTSQDGYPLWLTALGSEIRLWAFEDDATNGYRTTSGAGITTYSWHHIVATATYAGETKVYVNGTERLSFTNDGDVNWQNILTIGDLRPQRNITFDGLIDGVRIYNRTISAEQALALYQNNSRVIVSNETSVGDNWTVQAWANDRYNDSSLYNDSVVITSSDLDCGNLDSANTVYNLTQNLSANGNVCFNITADNITLNFNGYKINGSINISNADNITINNAWLDPEYGLILNSTTNSNFYNSTLTNISIKGIWILNNSHNNTFSNLSIDTTGSAHAIYIESGQNNLIDCKEKDINGTSTASTFGAYIQDNNNTIQNCTIQLFDYGAYYNSSDQSTLKDSTILNSSTDGIYLESTTNLNISSCTINNNSNKGIYIDSSSGSNTLYSNSICLNDEDISDQNESNTGTQDRCDISTNWDENNHFGCTYTCSSLWHRFFGNVSGNIALSDGTNSVYNWSASGLNVYYADYDSDIDWSSLQALGRTTSNTSSSNDFSELDNKLGSSSDHDNINSSYSTDGSSPKSTANFTVYMREIQSVPVANSTKAQTSFETGILWDVSDGGTEYSNSINQSTVWVSKVNVSAADAYGVHDYLIQVPDSLADYEGGTALVGIYVELR